LERTYTLGCHAVRLWRGQIGHVVCFDQKAGCKDPRVPPVMRERAILIVGVGIGVILPLIAMLVIVSSAFQ
jgi:hypothetical protein